ncbi:MAG: tRNA (adenosine(37)-N6)-dimethylallyltransferase MiaA [SAR324 cluster bacterium]|nr:tRNA (adenosine(37)-N6)-dimethylallyltransferase MiaA [SAR324 cluster bacterium]
MSLTKIIAVVGPTASGKTSLGLDLAAKLNSEIISVDSMQVFKGMDIGTAKPTAEQRKQVAHHLIDIMEPGAPYSAGKFAQHAKEVITGLVGQKKVPILLGGTNLYHRALTEGINEAPPATPEVKEEVWAKTQEERYDWLCDIDPGGAAMLHANDSARVARALEVKLTTGASLIQFQKAQDFTPSYDVFYLGRYWEREETYARINERTIEMFDMGFVKEVQGLLDAGIDTTLPCMNSIGYKQVVAHLAGEMTVEEMIEDVQKKTRRFAKKQRTWLRAMEDIHWLERDQELDEIFPVLQEFLDK